MKKTLVALAVAALAATSANAAVVYNQDGTQLKVSGDVGVMLQKSTGSRTDLKNDGSKVEFAASQDIGNGLSAVGALRLKVSGDDFKGLEVNKLWAGLKHQGVGAVTFGRQSTNANDVALGDYSNAFGGNSNLNTSATKDVKYRSADFGGFSFGADYLFGSADKKAPTGYKHGFGLAAFYTAKFAENVTLKANAGYTADRRFTVDAVTKADLRSPDVNDISDVIKAFRKGSHTAKSWLLASEITSGPVSVGVSYGQSKLGKFEYTETTPAATTSGTATTTTKKVDKVKLSTFILGVNYNITDSTNAYTQFQHNRVENRKGYGYILGVGHKLQSNVSTYAEYGRFKVRDGAASNNFGVGLKVSF